MVRAVRATLRVARRIAPAVGLVAELLPWSMVVVTGLAFIVGGATGRLWDWY